MKPQHRVGRHVTVLLVLLCPLYLLSCRTSDDAKAAAQQLATTSNDLANYYSALSTIVSTDVDLNELQNALEGVPFADSDRALLTDTSAELQKRADVAKALQGLSAAFTNLTGSTAPADVSDAASKLSTELTSLKAIPQAGSPIPLPSAIADAAKLVVTLVQEHEERKAAPAMDATLSALRTLFSQEQPAYDSLNKVSATLAGSLARYCIDQNLVSDASVLGPALQPFNLTASLPSGGNSASLNAVAKTRVDEQTAQLVAKQNGGLGRNAPGVDGNEHSFASTCHRRAHDITRDSDHPDHG